MLVVLKENVENLGRIGDVVKVSPGYARNFLLPKKLGVAADEGNIRQIEHQKKLLEKKRLALKSSYKELAAKLAEVTCTISKKVGENDRIFGSVSSMDVVNALKTAGFSIEKRMVQIDPPIKTVGVHSLKVKLDQDITAQIKVWIVKDET
jgi:large subunit ribosomal protein L9